MNFDAGYQLPVALPAVGVGRRWPRVMRSLCERNDHLGPVPHTELAVDLAQVELHGLRREEELGGDVPGGATAGGGGRDAGLLQGEG
jgi:hypothetical protein